MVIQKYIFICKNKFLALSKYYFLVLKKLNLFGLNLTALLGLLLFLFSLSNVYAQNASLEGTITDNGTSVPFANIYLKNTAIGTSSNEKGVFSLSDIPKGSYTLIVSMVGYKPFSKSIELKTSEKRTLNIQLIAAAEQLEETVVTGTLKAVKRSESPVPVEVYSPTFLKQNPTANIFEALQNVNGVRPQINCNVCNTGDIHINGLEGPYTLVLIDGMPIVSGLGTVYGLSGIPNALIEQIEIIKGPASSLYGSEAVGGLINIITKNSLEAPEFSADAFATGWGEYNLDVGGKISMGSKTMTSAISANRFNRMKDMLGRSDPKLFSERCSIRIFPVTAS